MLEDEHNQERYVTETLQCMSNTLTIQPHQPGRMGVFIVLHLFQFVSLCVPFSVLLHVLFENNLKSYRSKKDA